MQPLFILFAILLGILLPQGNELTFLIRYNLMLMLFLAFIGVDFKGKVLQIDHLIVVLINLCLPLTVFFLVQWYNYDLALVAFAVSVAPTAAGAPVIAVLLKSRIDFVTISVLLTNPMAAVTVPFFLPIVANSSGSIQLTDVLIPVFSVVFIPLLINFLVRAISYKLHQWFLSFRSIAFYLFLFNVYIASAKATDFITHTTSTSLFFIISIGVVVMLMCLLQFLMGEFIGKQDWKMERSLSVGRKNTMFSIWVCLTFLTPVIALGPMFYILFQNIYNTWQMYRR